LTSVFGYWLFVLLLQQPLCCAVAVLRRFSQTYIIIRGTGLLCGAYQAIVIYVLHVSAKLKLFQFTSSTGYSTKEKNQCESKKRTPPNVMRPQVLIGRPRPTQPVPTLPSWRGVRAAAVSLRCSLAHRTATRRPNPDSTSAGRPYWSAQVVPPWRLCRR